jgi:hypothetical protein
LFFSEEEYNCLYDILIKAKKENIKDKLLHLIETDNIPFVSSNYHCEKAIHEYYAVLESHNEGVAYSNLMEKMYFLNDDFNDKFYHFFVALERYTINCNHTQNKITELKKYSRNSDTYNVSNYIKTVFMGQDEN